MALLRSGALAYRSLRDWLRGEGINLWRMSSHLDSYMARCVMADAT